MVTCAPRLAWWWLGSHPVNWVKEMNVSSWPWLLPCILYSPEATDLLPGDPPLNKYPHPAPQPVTSIILVVLEENSSFLTVLQNIHFIIDMFSYSI